MVVLLTIRKHFMRNISCFQYKLTSQLGYTRLIVWNYKISGKVYLKTVLMIYGGNIVLSDCNIYWGVL